MNLQLQTQTNLNSIRTVLDQLSEVEYKKSLRVLENKSISQHVRHVLEFYQELVLGSKKGEINYDARNRSLRVESDIHFAKEFLNLLTLEMAEILEDKEIKLQVSSPIPNSMIDLQTSLFREISYCNEHTVHHLAILKIGILNEFSHIKLEEGFGVANATLHYERDLAKT
ncbi:MAG: hypothetical protein O9301_09810 [Leptospira sp.]|nr:hypothetical protein [Leptospira sp.]